MAIRIFFFLLLGFGTDVLAQERAIKVSIGIGKYFPDDDRYSHFFEHKPVSWSGQLGYSFWFLNVKGDFERFYINRNSTEQFYYRKAYPPDRVPYDSFLISGGIADVQSDIRSSTFRLGVSLNIWRTKVISPFLGIGGSLISSKGYGDSSLVRADTFYNNTSGGRPRGYYFIFDTSKVPNFDKSLLGGYVEAGFEAHLPYGIFLVFEAIHDFRSKNRAAVIGPAKGGTLIRLQMGYRIKL